MIHEIMSGFENMKIFPSGIAKGETFCNRVEERKQLKQSIENTQHTVLMAPRRYGKSSLITQVIQENNFVYFWIDFLSITTKEEVEEKIRTGIKQLLLFLSNDLKKLHLQTIEKVKSLSPEINLSAMGQSLTLHFSSNTSSSIDIMLTELDAYAQKLEKKAILVFDEFQQISELKDHHSVEALIRHAVERSQAITYIFSGSNRHMLGKMFSQSSRPLYRLCRIMTLDRIKEKEYLPFINKAAYLKWGKTLSGTCIQHILLLTECHPFYVNALCYEIWMHDDFQEDDLWIESVWESYVLQHKSIIVADIISLPLNQKKIVKELSQKPEKEIYSVSFAIQLKISTASIRRAIEALMLKDIVFEDENGFFRVLDPGVSYYFKHIF